MPRLKRTKAASAGVPLQQLIAYGLAVRSQRRKSRDRRITDPVAEAHKHLSRPERRALGDRRSEFGHGVLAASIKTRNAR